MKSIILTLGVALATLGIVETTSAQSWGNRGNYGGYRGGYQRGYYGGYQGGRYAGPGYRSARPYGSYQRGYPAYRDGNYGPRYGSPYGYAPYGGYYGQPGVTIRFGW
jgi:hypothetical protein